MSLRTVASSLSANPMPVDPLSHAVSLNVGCVQPVAATPPGPGEGSCVPLKYFQPGPASSIRTSSNWTLDSVGGVRAEAGYDLTWSGATLRTVQPVKHLASCSISSCV